MGSQRSERIAYARAVVAEGRPPPFGQGRVSVTTERDRDEVRWSRDMAAAHRGDARAYERLLSELGAVIERYIRRRFGPLAFGEDCVQECLLAIHSGRHTYDPKRLFRPWFFTIVRNKTVDFLRRSHAAARPIKGEEDALQDAMEPDPADELVAGELLQQLPQPYRDALELTRIIGYSTSEAAARAGISETAMRARVSRALRATEKLLGKEWNES
jgi:RNA polymerase sigma-70 factor (ECF subfamily)